MNKKIKLNNKGIVFVAVVLVVFLVSSCASPEIETDTDKDVQDTVVPATGSSENLGGLEISVGDADNAKYSLTVPKITDTETERIVAYEKVVKNYEKVYVEVFNPTTSDKTISAIKLTDDLGNEYQSDSNPDSTVELKEFGRAMIVSPSTKIKGYLFFLGIDEKAETLQLIFELESGEKKVFEFEK